MVSLLASVGVAMALPPSQSDPAPVRIQPVTGGVHLLSGPGGNVAVLVGEDGVFLVDAQLSDISDEVEAVIATVSNRPIRFVVNTHRHGDHTGGNRGFAADGAVIIAHDHVRKRMSTQQFSAFLDRVSPPAPREALPVVTFRDAVTFHMNGETIEVSHCGPAHTDGDAIVRFREANVLHLGDLYFEAGYPYIDVDSGGSARGLLRALDDVLATMRPDTILIPGHGSLSDVAGLRAYRDMLEVVVERVGRRVRAGESLEQILAGRPTEEYDDRWGAHLIPAAQFVELVYRSLMEEAARLPHLQ